MDVHFPFSDTWVTSCVRSSNSNHVESEDLVVETSVRLLRIEMPELLLHVLHRVVWLECYVCLLVFLPESVRPNLKWKRSLHLASTLILRGNPTIFENYF